MGQVTKYEETEQGNHRWQDQPPDLEWHRVEGCLPLAQPQHGGADAAGEHGAGEDVCWPMCSQINPR